MYFYYYSMYTYDDLESVQECVHQGCRCQQTLPIGRAAPPSCTAAQTNWEYLLYDVHAHATMQSQTL